jgi:hypothetical protein
LKRSGVVPASVNVEDIAANLVDSQFVEKVARQ